MITLHCHSRFPISLPSSSSPLIKSKHSLLSCNRNHDFFSKQNLFEKKRNQTTVRKSQYKDDVEPVQASSFFDENGVVEDMDGYLNYLSLEYDSVWDTKPSWCQPWTIVLTGFGIITCSWLTLQSVVVTSLAALLIGFWWFIFLYSYPKEYSDMIAERRRKVTRGQEDTYGKET